MRPDRSWPHDSAALVRRSGTGRGLAGIGGRPIGPGTPVFVIAEIGLNHGGSLERALALVDAAAAAGAGAIKLQTLVGDRLVAPACPAPVHVKATSLQAFFARFELDAEAHRAIVRRARAHGLAVMTTPFAIELLPMLESLDLDAYKIASGDLTYDGLIEATAATGRPLVLSTGMAGVDEIAHAVQVAAGAGGDALALLHCVSAYPTPLEAENLRAIRTLADTFDLPVGLSDHGRGPGSAIAAVALGAVIYERHLVLEDDDEAIDAAVSSTPAALRAIVQVMEETRIALGSGTKECLAAEAPNRGPSRRGLYATRSLTAGETVCPADVTALRPATAVTPVQIGRLVGQVLARDIPAGAPFHADDLRPGEPCGRHEARAADGTPGRGVRRGHRVFRRAAGRWV